MNSVVGKSVTFSNVIGRSRSVSGVRSFYSFVRNINVVNASFLWFR